MAKNRSNNKRASKEAREADAFIKSSGQLLQWIEKNRALVVAVFVGAGVVAAAFAGYNWFSQEQELKAQEAFYQAELSLKKVLDAKQETSEKDKKDSSEEKLSDAEFSKKFEVAIRQFEGVIKDHAGQRAAVLAGFSLAELYKDHQKYENAIAAVDSISKGLSADQELYGLAHFMKGTLQYKNENCQAAIQSWQLVAGSPAADFIHPEALLRQGLCHEKLKQWDEALKSYSRVSEEFKDTDSARRARSFLRLLKLKRSEAS